MTSPDSDIKAIAKEIKYNSLKKEQLEERKKILLVFQELRNRVDSGQTEEADSNRKEIDSIDEKLEELHQKQAELQKSYDNMLNSIKKEADKEHKKEVHFTPEENVHPPSGSSNVVYVEPPPTIPAPTVILDLKKLPTTPCRTQCPECRQFVTTETYTSVSSVTWLVCITAALIGCAAGCCLIPFCIDKFKSVTHRCPKCRTSIQTIKKL
ncbi:lipopolysaccharide-induced tumor necrosis factor-alpha factor homolog [Archocentrus centrarchus]|uniref:lipopolysaccharide-induced tumor necrosis factor-alpha factor homolog n=1 Tax=Archocentrus centrarchus TaxID=63155 RepID=UPI0011E9BC80|nr:lipopolysaccharide-induced tumor necrosis factor-alpha factor homolog [Archocentrus centrarchus]